MFLEPKFQDFGVLGVGFIGAGLCLGLYLEALVGSHKWGSNCDS